MMEAGEPVQPREDLEQQELALARERLSNSTARQVLREHREMLLRQQQEQLCRGPC